MYINIETRIDRLARGGALARGDQQVRCGCGDRKADIRLPGKGNSSSYGARPVHQIIWQITWIRTGRLSIKNSLSNPLQAPAGPGWTTSCRGTSLT